MISTSPAFHAAAQGGVRAISNRLNISWTKQRSASTDWFTLDQSQLNGSDILATNETEAIQPWDSYEWMNESERLTSIGWNRSIEFPYGVQSATADFSLDNHDGRYTIDGTLKRWSLGEIYGGTYQQEGTGTISRPIQTVTGTATVHARITGTPLILETLDLGDIELAELNDDTWTRDRIYKANNTWRITKAVGKRTHAIADIQLDESFENLKFVTLPKSQDASAYGNTNDHFAWCNKADYAEPEELDSIENIGKIISTASATRFYIGVPKTTTITMARIAFASTTIYYELSNHGDFAIADQNLIDELDRLEIAFQNLRTDDHASFTIDQNLASGEITAETHETQGEITDFILPERPVRIYTGFKKRNEAIELIPAFVGLTKQLPQYEGDRESIANFTASDFLSQIAETQLNETIALRDARTDEAIEQILLQYGMDSSMFNLAPGENIIPYAVFESGLSAGNTLRKLVQAENGKLWLDELGIIRFEPRTGDLGKVPVMTFNETNIIAFKPSHESGIINHIKIKSDIRQVQENQVIWSADNENGFESAPADDDYRISAFGNLNIWLNLDDPAWSASPLIFNGAETSSNFTAKNLAGNRVESGLTATGTLFTDSYKLTIQNANAYPVSIDFIQLWGEPARIVDTINYDAFDDDSVQKFGEQILEISDNNYFGSTGNADRYATSILSNRAQYNPTITMTVKGDPALQLGDIIELDYKEFGTFKVTAINTRIGTDGVSTELTAERTRILTVFTLDKSRLDGGDVLA